MNKNIGGFCGMNVTKVNFDIEKSNILLRRKLWGRKKMQCKIWELREFDLEYLINKDVYLNELYLP